MANAAAAPGQLVKVSKSTPKAFQKAYCHKPIMVVITQPHDILGEKELIETRSAARAVKDLALIEFDAGDFKGQGDIVTMLGLFKTPAVAIVTRDGKIEGFWTTFVDGQYLGSHLRAAAAAKRCVGTPDDPAPAPAAGSELANAATLAASDAPTSAATSSGSTVSFDTGAGASAPAADPNAPAPAAAPASV